MTKKRFGSGERLCALQLFLKSWWWQYILMATLGWRRLWSCLIENFGALRNLSPDIAKILGRCHKCQTTKARRGKQPDTCEFAPVPQYPFTSLAIDFCKLPECLQKSTGKKVDYLMVIICRQTGYVLAIPCHEKALDSKNAASLFLDRCVHIPLAEYVGRASTLHPSGRFFVLPVCHCFLGR